MLPMPWLRDTVNTALPASSSTVTSAMDMAGRLPSTMVPTAVASAKVAFWVWPLGQLNSKSNVSWFSL